MMIEEKDIRAAGFQKITHGGWYRHPKWYAVGRYNNHNPEITPIRKVVEGTPATEMDYWSASIGALQWKLRTPEDLARFMEKSLPIYCDPVD